MRLLLSLLLILPLLSSPSRAAPGMTIVAAENFYGELAREIAGPDADITAILSRPDADPHLFEVTPSSARLLSRADIVIYNGAGYDPWMARLLAVAGRDDRTILDVQSLVHAEEGANPHLWYRPDAMPALASALASVLARRDPANAARYQANLAAFRDRFAAVEREIADLKARFAGAPVTATEPVFGYMAAALGLDMRNIVFQTAMMNDTDPAPAAVAAFEADLTEHRVRLLFYNAQVTDATTAHLLELAKTAGIAVVGVTETMPEGSTIADWFHRQLDATAAALAAAR